MFGALSQSMLSYLNVEGGYCMARRSIILSVLLSAVLILPASASQFIELSFDDVARESAMVVRGTLGPVTSAWDDDHQVIYSYARIDVSRYFAGEGPRTLVIREAGGTVGNYTQQALGFPTLREGQDVVLMLAKWEDSADWRIHAYTQGKYLVRMVNGKELLVLDPITQGHERAISGGRDARTNAIDDESGMTVDEFAAMVNAARGARPERESKKN
jgi:hypothetical protein